MDAMERGVERRRHDVDRRDLDRRVAESQESSAGPSQRALVVGGRCQLSITHPPQKSPPHSRARPVFAGSGALRALTERTVTYALTAPPTSRIRRRPPRTARQPLPHGRLPLDHGRTGTEEDRQ